jgi:PEGA domain
MTQHQDGDDRLSIPEMLAHAIVVADEDQASSEADSPVDQWAFPELAEIAAPPAEDQSVVDDWALAAEDGLSRIDGPDLAEDLELHPVSTLRPSAITLRPPRKEPASTSRFAPLALFAAAAVGVLVWTQSGPDSAAAAPAPIEAPAAKPAPAEPAPAPVMARGMRLNTTIEGVKVIVGGETWGPLPVSLSHLGPGTHSLRFEAPGYETSTREVTIADAVVELDVTLDPKPVPLILEVQPPNAFIMITDSGRLDGARYTGPWPRQIDIAPGAYQIVAFRAGYAMVQRHITVKPGDKANAVRFELAREDLYE